MVLAAEAGYAHNPEFGLRRARCNPLLQPDSMMLGVGKPLRVSTPAPWKAKGGHGDPARMAREIWKVWRQPLGLAKKERRPSIRNRRVPASARYVALLLGAGCTCARPAPALVKRPEGEGWLDQVIGLVQRFCLGFADWRAGQIRAPLSGTKCLFALGFSSGCRHWNGRSRGPQRPRRPHR